MRGFACAEPAQCNKPVQEGGSVPAELWVELYAVVSAVTESHDLDGTGFALSQQLKGVG